MHCWNWHIWKESTTILKFSSCVKKNINHRALACRLESRGIPHVIASRTPRQGQLSLEDGLREALLILAVPAHTVRTLPLESLPKESIVVDCSNRTRRCGEDELSQAEQLAAALPPGPVVVKALNTVSGYFLEQVTEQSVKPVPIASDSASAKVGKEPRSIRYRESQTFPGPGHGCQPLNLSWTQPHGHGWAFSCSQVSFSMWQMSDHTYHRYVKLYGWNCNCVAL